MKTKYSLAEIRKMPVLAQGQADDLIVDEGKTRVWISRCTVDDGEPFDNKVTVEILNSTGQWITLQTYEAV